MEKYTQVIEDRHLCFTRKVFQAVHLVKPVLEMHIIRYIENIQMQLSKAALLQNALCYKKIFYIYSHFFSSRKILFDTFLYSMLHQRHSTNTDVKTSVFCKSSITHSTIHLSTMRKVIHLFWRKSNIKLYLIQANTYTRTKEEKRKKKESPIISEFPHLGKHRIEFRFRRNIWILWHTRIKYVRNASAIVKRGRLGYNTKRLPSESCSIWCEMETGLFYSCEYNLCETQHFHWLRRHTLQALSIVGLVVWDFIYLLFNFKRKQNLKLREKV